MREDVAADDAVDIIGPIFGAILCLARVVACHPTMRERSVRTRGDLGDVVCTFDAALFVAKPTGTG